MQWIHITKEDILKKFQHATIVNFKLEHGSIDRKCYDEDTVKLIMDSYTHADYVNIAVDGHKVFFVDEVRKLLNELHKEEISLSKFIEELNVKANRVTMNHSEPTGSGWMDCKDRLPEFIESRNNCSDNVFAICDGRLMIMAYCEINGMERYHAWCNCYDEIGGDPQNDDNYNVTHWMPLPLPPKP